MRSQKERLAMAEVLLSGIWEEFSKGIIENGIDQEAVNIQIDVNRIIFKLNEHRDKRFFRSVDEFIEHATAEAKQQLEEERKEE